MSLKYSILALLSRAPKTGYELSKGGEESVRLFWNATHQQVYKDLAELQNRGWVEHKDIHQDDRPDKKIYSVTPLGMSELKKWLKKPTEVVPTKDAFLIKLFVGHLIAPRELLADLLVHKETHLELRAKYEEIKTKYFSKSPLPATRQFQLLTLKKGIAYEAMWLKWCEEVEKFLTQL